VIKKSAILFCLIGLLLSNLWPSVQGKIEGIVTDSSSNKELGEVLGQSENYEEAKVYYQRAIELSLDEQETFYIHLCRI